MHNQIVSFNFTADLEKVHPWAKSNWSHTDLPRLRKGMVGAQVSRNGQKRGMVRTKVE
jgi:membrane dipeptidase